MGSVTQLEGGRFILRVILPALLSLVCILGAGPKRTVAASQPVLSRPQEYYLSLGDSLAFGYQDARVRAEIRAVGTVNPAHFDTGYTDDFAAMLNAVHPGIQTVNYGCPGETTVSFSESHGCPWKYPLHNSFAGSQLDAALAFLHAHPGAVSPITLSLGGNDLLGVIKACALTLTESCLQVKAALATEQTASRLDSILTQLRQAAPAAKIIVLQYYNPVAVMAPGTNGMIERLDRVVAAAAVAHGVAVANLFAVFNQTQPQPTTLCHLTLFCQVVPGSLPDIHASDAGYAVIANQLWAASGYARLGGVFMVGFDSQRAGQGEVFFGSGPACFGLEEVATRDLHPQTTRHDVLVMGNDLGGAVGDNGVIPGVTYRYEGVTVSPVGGEFDDNSGQCYSITIPNTYG